MPFMRKLSHNATWIDLNSDRIADGSQLYNEYEIDPKTIEYALDKNEHAHMDYNREDGTVTFIYSVLDLEKDKEYYETVPLTFLAQKSRLITISNQDSISSAGCVNMRTHTKNCPFIPFCLPHLK